MFTIKLNHHLQNIWIMEAMTGKKTSKESFKAFLAMLLEAADRYEESLSSLVADEKMDEKSIVFKVLDKTTGKNGKPLGEVRIRMNTMEVVLTARRIGFVLSMLKITDKNFDCMELLREEGIAFCHEKMAMAKKASDGIKITLDGAEKQRILSWKGDVTVLSPKPATTQTP